MAKSLCVLIRRAPYGTIHAAEALRLVNGGLVNGLKTVAVLIHDGVYLAKQGQNPRGTGWTPLGQALEECLQIKARDIEPVQVYVHRPSLAARQMDAQDLILGTEVVEDDVVAQILVGSDSLAVF
ncbi:MAG: DsrE family protein [Firmicutes bacterium]|nr:DsrE family protein [Bacillota bacterium]MCL5039281.1 DsrE family protein [Bacillota bacterium]